MPPPPPPASASRPSPRLGPGRPWDVFDSSNYQSLPSRAFGGFGGFPGYRPPVRDRGGRGGAWASLGPGLGLCLAGRAAATVGRAARPARAQRSEFRPPPWGPCRHRADPGTFPRRDRTRMPPSRSRRPRRWARPEGPASAHHDARAGAARAEFFIASGAGPGAAGPRPPGL